MSQRKNQVAKQLEKFENDYCYNLNGLPAMKEIAAYMLDATAGYPKTKPQDTTAWGVNSFFNSINEWADEDDRLFSVVMDKDYWAFDQGTITRFFCYYLEEQELALQKKGIDVMPFMTAIWAKHNPNEDDLLKNMADSISFSDWRIRGKNSGEYTLNSIGEYMMAQIKKDAKKVVPYCNFYDTTSIFEWICEKMPDFDEAQYACFLEPKIRDYEVKEIDPKIVNLILEKNAEKHEALIVEKIKDVNSAESIYYIHEALRKHLPNTQGKNELAHAYAFIAVTIEEMGHHPYDPKYHYVPYAFPFISDNPLYKKYYLLIEKIVEFVLENDADNAKEVIADLFKKVNNPEIKNVLLPHFVKKYGNATLPALFEGGLYYHKHEWATPAYLEMFFKCLANLDYTNYENEVWALAVHKEKGVRLGAGVALAKLGDKVIPKAEKLLNDKKSDNRQIGALILSTLKTPAAVVVLMEKLNSEADDNTRDIMLESIKNILPKPKNTAEMQAIIAAAKNRKKLAERVHYSLEEDRFPKPHWLSGGELTLEETRFLFYRQSRCNDIRIDAEVKLMLPLLDKTKSAAFANALVRVFTEGYADTKIKYLLPLATSLGGDKEIDLLKAEILKWVDSGRGKMAEYAVKAIALNGAPKALRLMEFYARKYKSKYKNIGAAANESFALVAEELHISPYDLADTIIPDFGFEGLFKEFEAGGETYRAFVNNDFKIAYLDEDNKTLKALPKAASTDIKTEFKDTEKEIKDILKTQTNRLENYLIIQRRWSAEKWTALFLQNPVQFVYAVRIIWGAYANDGSLVYTFCCQEDQTLVNAKGEEITLDANHNIGLAHPIDLDAATIAHWKQHQKDAKITPVFPQLARTVTHLNPQQKNDTMDNRFEGIAYNGYGFLGQMQKNDWSKMVGDAGLINSYYKTFPEYKVIAFIAQTGMHGIELYEENAVMGKFFFVKEIVLQPEAYYYEDPRLPHDPRLIPFGEIPAIVYSEVVADLTFFV
jgi:Domain of unknown function (DUF4132)